MDKIEVCLYAPTQVTRCKNLTVGSARLTQRAEKITCTEDLINLMQKSVSDKTLTAMMSLPHNNIRCFGTITMFIVGASRRFLAQITRRRTGVTFCSGSLQYSDWSKNPKDVEEQFVVPYEVLAKDVYRCGYADLEQGYYRRNFIKSCTTAMTNYEKMIKCGLDRDTAGYVAPQSLRNVLIVDATPQAWIEMIRQRACKRNTDETRYILLKCWEKLNRVDPVMFSAATCLPSCYMGACLEQKMTCGKPYDHEKYKDVTEALPATIINDEFPAIKFIKDLQIQEENNGLD